MTDNVGLSTPRGSGTSGYVQRNLSHLKPRQQASNPSNRFSPYSKPGRDELLDGQRYRQRQPDREILEHERRRKVEVQVLELRDRLEDEGADDDSIDEQTTALRNKLLADFEAASAAGAAPLRRAGAGGASESSAGGDGTGGGGRDVLKRHQVHELAEMKIKESERLRKAFGIKEGYEEGSYWREREEKKAARGAEKGERTKDCD